MMPHFRRGQAPSEPRAYFRFGWEQMTEEEAEEKRQECAISQEDIDELNRLVNLHHERVNGNG